jgi:hypothetical protein
MFTEPQRYILNTQVKCVIKKLSIKLGYLLQIYYPTNFQDPIIGGACVTPTSKVCMAAMFVILMAVD